MLEVACNLLQTDLLSLLADTDVDRLAELHQHSGQLQSLHAYQRQAQQEESLKRSTRSLPQQSVAILP